MYSPLQLAIKYSSYFFRASNGKGHGMHSPFVFELITKVMNDRANYPEYSKIEALRSTLKKDHTMLTIEDMGAGSAVTNTRQRTVASIAQNAAKPAKYGQLLYRMANYYKPATIVELGTSLGISAAYLASGQPAAKMITMEGATAVAAQARKNFAALGLSHVQLVEGNFDDTLPGVVRQNPSIDFAFIDGNHRKTPTENYFNQLLPAIDNDTLLVFDDIHWSREMEEAWQTIGEHPAVRCTIDLFFIGIVVFRREFKEKQHFAVRF